jgi:YVTN family beta-propeller protein
VSERQSGTVTFLFTDIEGSTSLLRRLGRERYGELLARQQVLLRKAFAANRGEEVDTQGDSFFVAFRSASDAVAAAVAVQQALADQERPDGAEVGVRVGIHTGEAVAAGERYVGFSVHRAARIGGVAHGGQVLVSSSTRELVEDDLPPGVSLLDLGLHRLKDVERPERISQVAADGLKRDFPPLRGAERVRAPLLRRSSLWAAALVGVVAAAVAIPVFALGSGGSSNSPSFAAVAANAVGAVDSSSGRIVASVPLAAYPKAIAYGEGSVWVSNPTHDSVSRIDPRTNTVQQTITVGNGPAGIAVGGGFVWVADSLAGTATQIDPRTNGGQVVRTIRRVGNGPGGLAYGLGGVWVANAVDRTVVRIDPDSGTPGRPIAVEDGADAVAVGHGAVWVASESAGVLSRIDPAAGSVTNTINVGNGPAAVAVAPGAVWVANSHDATVSRIDPATNRVKTLIPVGEGPSGIAVTPGTGDVWVANELAGTLSRIDPTVDRPDKTVTVGDLPQGVAAGPGTTYVSVRGSSVSHVGGTLRVAVANPSGAYGPGLPKSLDPSYGYTAWELLALTNDGSSVTAAPAGPAATRSYRTSPSRFRRSATGAPRTRSSSGPGFAIRAGRW